MNCHPYPETLTCDPCDVDFADLDELTDHRLEHHNAGEPRLA